MSPSRAEAYPKHLGTSSILAKNKLRDPVGNCGPQISVVWNIFEWQVAD